MNAGDIYRNPLGREVEILAVEELVSQWFEKIDVVAYRFIGATMVHLRPLDHLNEWQKVGVHG